MKKATKFYQLITPVMFSIMYTTTIFVAEKTAPSFKVEAINNLIDEFRGNNNLINDGFYREINHTQSYSPLLDLITSYTGETSTGMDIFRSIVTTAWHGAVLLFLAHNGLTIKNRLMLLNKKDVIK